MIVLRYIESEIIFYVTKVIEQKISDSELIASLFY